MHAVKWLQITQVPKSHPTETCHIKAAGLRCQVVISCLSAMQSSLAPGGGVIAVWLHVFEMCSGCLTDMATDNAGTKIASKQKHVTVFDCMVSNGYRWRRYDNLIQHKHVTVYAKVQVMQQRCLSHQVPRLPRETKVDVSKCHACHANSRGVPVLHADPSATGASPLPYVPRLPRKSVSRCHQVPRQPSETKVDISKCHACHANCRTCHSCHAKVEVARLPRETKMDVSKCRARLPRQQPRRPGDTPKTKRATRASPVP